MKETVNIHGKEYETVASRVKRFRAEKPSYSIVTDIVMHDNDKVIIKASILDNGIILATGHAEEVRKSSKINQTSAVENCETSAIGRALACFGYLGSEFASADEVVNAIAQQQGTTEKHAQKQPDLVQVIKAEAADIIKNSNLSAEVKATFRARYQTIASEEEAKKFKADVQAALVSHTFVEDDSDIPFDNKSVGLF